MKTTIALSAGIFVLAFLLGKQAFADKFEDKTNTKDAKFGAYVKLSKESDITVETDSGIVVNISSSNDGDGIGVANGLKNIATISNHADSGVRVSRYIQKPNRNSETWILDRDGDGYPDESLEWVDGEIVKSLKIDLKFTEIKTSPPAITNDK